MAVNSIVHLDIHVIVNSSLPLNTGYSPYSWLLCCEYFARKPIIYKYNILIGPVFSYYAVLW